jgi:hypothetical protein
MATTHPFERPGSNSSGFKHTEQRAWRQWALLFGCLFLLFRPGYATENVSTDNASRLNLPELPGENSLAPATLDMDAKSIAVGETTYVDTWGATLGGYREADPTIAIQQGWLLNDTLGAGSVYTFHSDYTEAMINGVYAPQPDLRIQLTASQMRSKTHLIASSGGGGAQTVLHTSRLLDVQKKWQHGGVLSEAGVAFFSADAKPRNAKEEPGPASTDMQDTSAGRPDRLATGRLNGYALNLVLQPSYWSSIRMAYERKDISYHGAGSRSATDTQASGSIEYAHSFKNCSALHGRYSRATYSDEMNLHFNEGNWNLGVVHTRTDSYRDTALQVNYSMQLGGANRAATKCTPQPDAAPSFETIVDTTTARPERLVQEQLVKAESAALPETSVE